MPQAPSPHEYSIEALVAQAAYGLFDQATPPNALIREGSGDFSTSEAGRFLGTQVGDGSGFQLRHHLPNDSSGLSASVFLDRSSNKYVLGIRGTEGSLLDVIEDINRIGFQGFAGDQLVSLYRYYRKLTTPAGQAVQYSDSEVSLLQAIRLGIGTSIASLAFNAATTFKFRGQLAQDVGIPVEAGSGPSVLPPGAPLVVTGHSLGGHLALLFGRFFPEVTEHVYTYNAPGIGLHGELALRVMGIPPSPPSLVTNVSAVMGNEAISRIWSKPGETIGIATEPGSPVHEHSIVPLTDTLALYDAFGTLSPGLAANAAMVSGIISAASPFSENSVEVVLDHLGKLLDTGSLPTLIARAGSDLAEREDYYDNLYSVLDGSEAGRDYQIVSLVGKTALEMSSMSATDMSVRFALKNLSPFAAKNADLSEFDGSVFSGMWIASRSEMLEAMLANNVIDRPYGTTGSSDSIVYRDVDLGVSFAKLSDAQLQVALPMASAPRTTLLSFLSDSTYARSVVFGSDSETEGDQLVGLAMGDRLFGGAGDDEINGSSGDDILDGGEGVDELLGGDGDDTLDGGDGPDRLDGGSGLDTYLFEPVLDSDTIVDRDGRIYAGTTLLTGGIGGGDGAPYQSSDGLFSYEFTGDLQTGGMLVINGALRVEDFRNGDLGIRLVDGEIELAEWELEADVELLGDFFHQSIEISPGQFVLLDPFGNPLPISRISPVPDLDDNHLVYPGTPGNTHFIMGGGNDAVQDIYGGDDHIDLGTGDDVGFGGRGDDLVEGGPGRDFVVGGRGNDVLYAGSAATADADLDDQAVGTRSDGGDVLSGGDGDDVLVGDAEANLIEGGIGQDRIFGGAGDDSIGGDLANIASLEQYQIQVQYHEFFIDRFGDFLWVHDHSPSYSFGFSYGAFWGNLVEGPADGVDWIDAGAGNDRIYAGGGDDFVLAGAGDDFVDLGTGAHVAFGGSGKDTFYAYGGAPDGRGDYIDGGEGDDAITTGDGDDVLVGGDGNDGLFAHAGNDLLIGGAGNDLLAAGGNAVLDGGSGNDLLFSNAVQTGQEIRFRMGLGYGSDVAFSLIGTSIVEMVGEIGPREIAISAAEQEIVLPSNQGSLGVLPGMRIDIGGNGDSLFLLGWHQVTEFNDRRIEFSDGTVWDDAYIQSLLDAPDPTEEQPAVLEGSSAGDLIYGTAGPETLSGGLGDDWLVGDAGSDTYAYAEGEGFDRIEDLDATPGNADVLQFAEGINADDVSVFSIGNDYVLETESGGVRLMGGRTSEGAVEHVDFADGTRWTLADLEARAEVLPANRAPEMLESFGRVSTDPGNRVEFALPDNAVSDPDRFDAISLYAITADGEKLPEWLQFDAASRTLAGTPGQGDAGVHELLFIAADGSGAAAAGGFTIQVGQIAPAPEPAAPAVEVFAESPPSTPQLLPAVEPVGAEPAVAPALPAPAPRENAFATAATFNAALEAPRVLMDSAEPAFRDIQHSLDVLVQTGRTNLGERYAEAIREFEERRLEREEVPHAPPPTEEEIEAWNSAMHSWHDRHEGFAETDLGGSGAWGMGWGLNSPAESALGGAPIASLSGLLNPNLHARLQGVASTPALSEGFQHLR